MTTSELEQSDKDEIAKIYEGCKDDFMKNLNVQGSCEKQLEGLADRKFQSSYFKLAVKDEYIKKIKDYFCVTYPGVGFCPATPSPAPQQAAPQGPPQLTPEQIQQQQMMIQQQHMMQQQQQALSMLTTPSGFIGNNPGISIGLAVILISGFCFFAAFAISFLTAKNQKPTVNKGRPQNRARRQSKNGNKPKKGRSSCVSKLEKGKRIEKKEEIDGNEEKEDGKEEKPKSSYSKSKKGKSKKSAESTS